MVKNKNARKEPEQPEKPDQAHFPLLFKFGFFKVETQGNSVANTKTLVACIVFIIIVIVLIGGILLLVSPATQQLCIQALLRSIR